MSVWVLEGRGLGYGLVWVRLGVGVKGEGWI